MSYTISEVAEQLAIPVDTLRYYEKIKLIPRPSRDGGGRRQYNDKDCSRLRFVRRAQAMGFSLAEIRDLLRLRENPAKASKRVRALAEKKQREIETRLEQLQQLHGEFELLLNLCTGDKESCPILESFDRPASIEKSDS